MIVGDVRGKGVEAVQTAAAVLGAFRAAAFTASDLAELARTIDETLARMAARHVTSLLVTTPEGVLLGELRRPADHAEARR